MKKSAEKHNGNRILGRRLARELPNEQLKGVAAGVWTWTLLYPSDPSGPYWDTGGGGPIWV